MQMKLDWDIDPASTAEVQPCSLLDHLDRFASDVESELFVSLGCSPPTLPNDDIWKKFDDFNDLEDIDEILKDVSLGWLGQPCDAQPTGKDAREIRNHDCMWAGHCASDKHDKSYRTRHIMPVRIEPREVREPKVVPIATNVVAPDIKKKVVAPTSERSLLIPPRVVPRVVKPLDSGGESPRPETPLSLSEDEELDYDDLRLATITGIPDDELDLYLEQSDEDECAGNQVQVSPSKVTGQTNVAGVQVSRPELVNIDRHYTSNGIMSDHSYHLSKNTKMDHLGVQTPSDSEEEIDVETVCGDSKKPHSRSSSSGGGCGGAILPNNPSLLDRHHLQLTVASAISKKDAKRQSVRAASVPSRYCLDERTSDRKRKSEVKRTSGKKRGAPSEDRELGRKRKRQRHFKSKRAKSRRRIGHSRHAATGSSDSELDSTEKRSQHNNMERQRRVDLRNSFEELRMLIPDTADNQRAPKVLILKRGSEFSIQLTEQERKLTDQKAQLLRKQEMLRAHVFELRRSLASRRPYRI